MKPTLLILAAGMGSRYGGLKQLEPLGPNGETILEYSVYDAMQAGFGKVVLVIRESFVEEFKKITAKFSGLIEVDYAFQEINIRVEGIPDIAKRDKPWGIVHAVLSAEEKVQTPFAVINADDYYGKEAFIKMAGFLKDKCEPGHYAMVGYSAGKTLSQFGGVSRGLCEIMDGYLISVVECKEVRRIDDSIHYLEDGKSNAMKEDEIISMNFWGVHLSFFEHTKRLFYKFVKTHKNQLDAEMVMSKAITPLLNDKNKVSVLLSNDQWYGVTYKEDSPMVKAALNTFHREGIYPSPLF